MNAGAGKSGTLTLEALAKHDKIETPIYFNHGGRQDDMESVVSVATSQYSVRTHIPHFQERRSHPRLNRKRIATREVKAARKQGEKRGFVEGQNGRFLVIYRGNQYVFEKDKKTAITVFPVTVDVASSRYKFFHQSRGVVFNFISEIIKGVDCDQLDISKLKSVRFFLQKNNLLHIAVKFAETLKEIDFCIDRLKFDIDTRRKDGNTPLLFAAYGNRREVVDHLLSRGANPELTNKYGETYLDFYKRWDEYGDNVSKMNGAWIQLREDGTRNTWWWEVESPAAYCAFQDGTKVRSHLGIFKQDGSMKVNLSGWIFELSDIVKCEDRLISGHKLKGGDFAWERIKPHERKFVIDAKLDDVVFSRSEKIPEKYRPAQS